MFGKHAHKRARADLSTGSDWNASTFLCPQRLAPGYGQLVSAAYANTKNHTQTHRERESRGRGARGIYTIAMHTSAKVRRLRG